MPVDWKPENPIGEFIKCRSCAKQREGFKGKVFGEMGQAREMIGKAPGNAKRKPYDVEGVFKVQRFLLVHLRGRRMERKDYLRRIRLK